MKVIFITDGTVTSQHRPGIKPFSLLASEAIPSVTHVGRSTVVDRPLWRKNGAGESKS
jgi:hypothetical protein